MRNAYFALHGALYGYWGYAPVRPIRRAAAATRFTAAAKAPGPRPLGGLSDLAAPALAPLPDHALKISPPPHFNLLVVIIDIRRCWLCQRTHTLNIHPIHNRLIQSLLLPLKNRHDLLLQEFLRLLRGPANE